MLPPSLNKGELITWLTILGRQKTYDSSISDNDAHVDSETDLPLFSCGETVEHQLVVRADLKSTEDATNSIAVLEAKAGGSVMHKTSNVTLTEDRSTSLPLKDWTISSVFKD